MAGGAETGGPARGFFECVGLLEGGFNALHDAELGDAVAGCDLVGFGGEVGQDDLEFASVAGVDDAGEGGDATDGEAAAVFDECAVGGRQFHGDAGADEAGGAGGELEGFAGEEVGGEVAEWTDVGVTRKLGGGVETLDFDGGIGRVRHTGLVSHGRRG